MHSFEARSAVSPTGADAVDDARALGAALASLFRVAHKVKATLRPSPGDEGHESAALGVLVHLVGTGPQRATALAGAMHADPSTVSRQVAHLVENGKVERRPDPADGRACLLAATEDGELAFHRLRCRRDDYLAGVIAHWSPQDRAQLHTLLDRFVTDLTESFDRGGWPGSGRRDEPATTDAAAPLPTLPEATPPTRENA